MGGSGGLEVYFLLLKKHIQEVDMFVSTNVCV